jgi:hypothetical protein
VGNFLDLERVAKFGLGIFQCFESGGDIGKVEDCLRYVEVEGGAYL